MHAISREENNFYARSFISVSSDMKKFLKAQFFDTHICYFSVYEEFVYSKTHCLTFARMKTKYNQ